MQQIRSTLFQHRSGKMTQNIFYSWFFIFAFIGRLEKQESGIRNRNRNLNWDQRVNWEALKPVPDTRVGIKFKMASSVILFWEIFSTVIVIPKVYSHSESDLQKKGKCILLLFLAVINCDCSCRSSNFRQIETATNQKPIDCEKQPLLVCDV